MSRNGGGCCNRRWIAVCRLLEWCQWLQLCLRTKTATGDNLPGCEYAPKRGQQTLIGLLCDLQWGLGRLSNDPDSTRRGKDGAESDVIKAEWALSTALLRVSEARSDSGVTAPNVAASRP